MTRQIYLVSTLSSCFDKLIKFNIYDFNFVLPRHLVLVKCLLAGWRAQWRAKLCSFGLFLFTGSALWDLEQKIRCQTFLWTNNQWFQQQQNMTNHNYSVLLEKGGHILPQNFFGWGKLSAIVSQWSCHDFLLIFIPLWVCTERDESTVWCGHAVTLCPWQGSVLNWL